MRRIVVFLSFFALILIPAAAQQPAPDPFNMWIFSPDSGQMTLLDAQGVAGVIDLPLPPEYAVLPNDNVAVSPDGQTFAYIVYKAGYVQPALAVYRVPERTIAALFAPEGMLFASLSVDARHHFSPDSRRFALGYATENGWELTVIDLQTLAIAGRVTHITPALADLPRTPDTLPVPLNFRTHNQLAFIVYEASALTYARYPAFVWDILGDTLTTGLGYVTAQVDVFTPTGEVIRAGTDDRLPSAAGAFTGAQYNALWRSTAASGLTAPFYTDAALSFANPRFVADGAHVLTGASDGTTERTLLIDRDGRLIGTLPDNQRIYDAAGTRTGFVYSTLNSEFAPTVVAVDLSAGLDQPAPLWTGEPFSAAARIAWVGHADPTTPYFTDTGNYAQWAEAAPALGGSDAEETTASSGSVTDSTLPLLEVLTVGGKATINTSNGDSLNVRSDVGTQYAIRAKARPGTVVDVLDGPRDADGFTWWKIRLPDGREGWAVQSASGQQTLLAGENTAPVTDTSAPANPTVRSGLALGDMAAVSLPPTLEALRLRNGPGLEFDIILLLPEGTLLRIIGGPTRVDDFTWWEVRTPEGNAGWAAEVIGSQRMLVKQ